MQLLAMQLPTLTRKRCACIYVRLSTELSSQWATARHVCNAIAWERHNRCWQDVNAYSDV